MGKSDVVMLTLLCVVVLAVFATIGFMVGVQSAMNEAVRRNFAEKVVDDSPFSHMAVYKWRNE